MSGLGGGRGWCFRSEEDEEKTRLVLSRVSPLGSSRSPCSWDPAGSAETQGHFLSLRSEAPRLAVSGWLS